MKYTAAANIPFGPDDFDNPDPQAQPRSVSEITAGWDNLLGELEIAQPKVAEGFFRWPHHGFFTRYSAQVKLPLRELLQEIDRVLIAQPDIICPRLIEGCRGHAWEAGKVLTLASMDILRPQLDPESQGRLLAGASEREPEWVAAHLDDVSLTPETLLEIATHASRRRDAALLAHVLQKGAGLMEMTFRRMEPLSRGEWSDESRWADEVARLSHRVADMLLETALVNAFPEGVELALEHGADPNLKLWRLERSYNSWHTTVNFPLTEWCGIIHDEPNSTSAVERVVTTLISHPSFAKGSAHFPALMVALQRGWHELCDRLLAAGVTFESEDTPEWTQKVLEGGDVDWSGCYWLWPEDLEMQTARRLADAIPLIPASEASWFHSAGAQGGTWMTPLSLLLEDRDLPHLVRYAAAGLPLRPTFQDCLRITQNKAVECLRWLLGKWQTSPDEHPKLINLISS